MDTFQRTLQESRVSTTYHSQCLKYNPQLLDEETENMKSLKRKDNYQRLTSKKTQMLEVSHTDFKTAVIAMLKDIKKNMLTTYEKISKCYREIETIKNKNSRTEKKTQYMTKIPLIGMGTECIWQKKKLTQRQ